jgi:hypothetical protein
MDASAITIDCPAGTVIDLNAKAANTDSAIFDTGIIPSTAEVNTYCQSSAFTDAANCSSYMKKDALVTDLNTKCVGKQTCQITKLN